MQIKTRGLKEDEIGLLKEFLYEAIFIPDGVKSSDKSVVTHPELALYYDGFGKGQADNLFLSDYFCATDIETET